MVAARIFRGEQLLPTSTPLPFFAYPVLVLLTKRRLRRGVFGSIVDLQAAIHRYIAEHNTEAKPFVWTADPDRVVSKRWRQPNRALTRADNYRRCRKHLDGSIADRPACHFKDLRSDPLARGLVSLRKPRNHGRRDLGHELPILLRRLMNHERRDLLLVDVAQARLDK